MSLWVGRYLAVGCLLGANHWRIGQDIPDDFNYPGNREKYYFDVLDMIDRETN